MFTAIDILEELFYQWRVSKSLENSVEVTTIAYVGKTSGMLSRVVELSNIVKAVYPYQLIMFTTNNNRIESICALNLFK